MAGDEGGDGAEEQFNSWIATGVEFIIFIFTPKFDWRLLGGASRRDSQATPPFWPSTCNTNG